MTTKTHEPPMALADVNQQLKTLDDAIRAQEATIATEQEAVRVARREREHMEIAQVLQRAGPADVEKLRAAELKVMAMLEAAERKLPALREAYQRLVATRPEAEALARREHLFQLRRHLGPAVAELQAALDGAARANAKVYAIEQQAAALCPHGSPLLRAARLSTGATNLGFGGHLAWREFISDGTSSRYEAWKRNAKSAIRVPADLSALLEPEPGTVTPQSFAEIYQRGVDLLVGGPQPKAPSQDRPAPRRFR